MNDSAGEPGMHTLLEAARCNPDLCKLTLSADFTDRVCTKYFSKALKSDPAFRDDLWNMLEGANALYERVKIRGIPSANIAGAKQMLHTIKAAVEHAGALPSAEFEKLGLALIVMLQNEANHASLKFLDRERILATILDGKRFRLLLNDTLTLIDGCLQIAPPDTLPERRSWALRAWCLCVLPFWVDRARLKPTLTKLSELGGVRIKSPIGKFSEECLSEIGIDAAYDLRSAFAFAKRQLAKDAQLKKLVLERDTAAVADLLANWKDRFPITFE